MITWCRDRVHGVGRGGDRRDWSLEPTPPRENYCHQQTQQANYFKRRWAMNFEATKSGIKLYHWDCPSKQEINAATRGCEEIPQV